MSPNLQAQTSILMKSKDVQLLGCFGVSVRIQCCDLRVLINRFKSEHSVLDFHVTQGLSI